MRPPKLPDAIWHWLSCQHQFRAILENKIFLVCIPKINENGFGPELIGPSCLESSKIGWFWDFLISKSKLSQVYRFFLTQAELSRLIWAVWIWTSYSPAMNKWARNRKACSSAYRIVQLLRKLQKDWKQNVCEFYFFRFLAPTENDITTVVTKLSELINHFILTQWWMTCFWS